MHSENESIDLNLIEIINELKTSINKNKGVNFDNEGFKKLEVLIKSEKLF